MVIPDASSVGFTWNQAPPARTLLSPLGFTAVVSSPQIAPPTNCVDCILSSPESSLLLAPFCGAFGGIAYFSELMLMLVSVGVPPRPTWSRFVTAHTLSWLPPLPVGSSEPSMYSAFGVPRDSAGCGASVSVVRPAKWTKCGLATPAIRSALSMAHISAPLNSGPWSENSSAVTYRLVWSIPILGWSPRQGQPLPPRSVVSIEYCVHSPSGLGLCRTAISREAAVNVLLMNRLVANQVWVERSNQQRGSLVNSAPPTLNRSLRLKGPRSDLPFVR